MLGNVLKQRKLVISATRGLDDYIHSQRGLSFVRYYGGNQRFLTRTDEPPLRTKRYDRYKDEQLEKSERSTCRPRTGSGYSYEHGSRSRNQHTTDDFRRPRESFRQHDDNRYRDRDWDRSRQRYNIPPKLERRTWAQRPVLNTSIPATDPETLIRAIRTAFPHVKNPTSIQAELIPAIHRGEDVILMDETGSGKTFGSVLALLSETQQSHLGITTLYIVPHRELAYQIESWCQKLLPEGSSPETIASHVQVLARPHVDTTLTSIKKTSPRILIATPGALTDAMQHKRSPLRLHLSLRRIIVDEVDVVMHLWDRYKQPRQKIRHQPEAVQAIDQILEDIWRLRRPKPQMVMMSATLWVHVRTWLFAQNGWMAERVVRLNGVNTRRGEEEDFVSSGNNNFVHSAVAVESNGTLRNALAVSSQDDYMPSAERGILSHRPSLILDALSSEGLTSTETTTPSPNAPRKAITSQPTSSRTLSEIKIPPSVFEAIATSVALDVTARAMCVLPAGSPVISIVEEFRKLGVDAQLLNLGEDIRQISRPIDEVKYLISKSVAGASGSMSDTKATNSNSAGEGTIDSTDEPLPNPALLVTTTKSVRGLDIPTLSHIYIVGGVDSVAVYRHIAGRVGRFGKHGAVVSFVSAEGSEYAVGGASGERRLQNYLKHIGANVVPFKHIQ